jgi:hypothetical protein
MIQLKIKRNAFESKVIRAEHRAKLLSAIKDAKWLGAMEAAAYMAYDSCSPVYTLWRSKKLPFTKRGGVRVTCKEWCDAYLEANRPPETINSFMTIEQAREILTRK